MATTFTAQLRLATPATGELSGTWGDVVNASVTTMVEQAISGKATVAMADANQTMTVANGATDQSRCMMIECTGAMTANRNVVCPTSSKLYIVNNLTTGGFSVVIKTTSGTGITVPSGATTLVYCDGTNVVIGENLVGGIKLSGTLSGLVIASAKTLTANNSLTLAGTDSTTQTFPATSQTIAGLGVVQAWTKSQSGTPVALTVSANAVAVDLSLGNNFSLTLQATTGQTLSNPSNPVAGASGNIAITQNATPSTLAYGSQWIEATTGTAIAVSTTASAQNIISYYVFDTTHIYYTLNKHGVA